MKKRLSPEVIREIEEALRADNLIGVVVFMKESDHVIGLGNIAGTNLAVQHDTFYGALQSIDSLSRTLDQKLADTFGREIVAMDPDDEEEVAKIAAGESLRDFLVARGVKILDVVNTPTALEVILGPDVGYEGPWEWEGHVVRVQV